MGPSCPVGGVATGACVGVLEGVVVEGGEMGESVGVAGAEGVVGEEGAVGGVVPIGTPSSS